MTRGAAIQAGIASTSETAELSRLAKSAWKRDLDNFFLEELQASGTFRSWFLMHLSHWLDLPTHMVVVGKDSTREIGIGQTDLSLAFVDETRDQLASGTLLV